MKRKWSGGSSDGVDPETGKKSLLMSRAIEAGLYHPRCRDAHTTYFPGISTADDTWTEEKLEAIGQANKEEAKRQYAERQAEKFGRLAKYSLDEGNQKQYKGKRDIWRMKLKGPGAADNSGDIPEHDPPVLKKTIDYDDQNAVSNQSEMPTDRCLE